MINGGTLPALTGCRQLHGKPAILILPQESSTGSRQHYGLLNQRTNHQLSHTVSH